MLTQEDFNAKFAKRIREIREEKELNIQELADLMEMERSALSRIESGTGGIYTYTFYRILEALHVNPNEFFKFD